jgi:hypothetical protein
MLQYFLMVREYPRYNEERRIYNHHGGLRKKLEKTAGNGRKCSKVMAFLQGKDVDKSI